MTFDDLWVKDTFKDLIKATPETFATNFTSNVYNVLYLLIFVLYMYEIHKVLLNI